MNTIGKSVFNILLSIHLIPYRSMKELINLVDHVSEIETIDRYIRRAPTNDGFKVKF